MCLPCRAPLLLLLLLCASSVLAQEQGIPNAIEGVDLKLIDEHTALQKAEKQEEATEHAPISHEQAPAALEDVDEFKGGSSSVSESEVEHEKEMDHENEDNEHGHDHPSDAAHISTALSTLSGAYAVAVPVQSPGSEATISSPDCLVSAGAEACSGHGVCQLNPGSEQHFCECTEGWFGPHCQCGEQPDECSESNHCHWCGPLSLCLTSKEECEAGESALHGQVHRSCYFSCCKFQVCNAMSGAPQSGHPAPPVSRASDCWRAAQTDL